MNDKPTYPIVLTIAGSDSSGGAGIQADIKTISALGGYAARVITAITAQNTQGVRAIHAVPLDVISAQLDAVFTDLDVKAVKIGMLSDSGIISLVAAKLKEYNCQNIVVDPVMVATSGDTLLKQNAISVLKTELMPLADVITPNLPEGAMLTSLSEAQDKAQMQQLVNALLTTGAKSVLLKGGHLQGELSSDLFSSGDEQLWLETQRVATENTHGTGCTLSSAVATNLAKGMSLTDAVKGAKAYITQAIKQADELDIGSGHGPVNHFYDLNVYE